jgi:hypothetical protein
VRITSVLVLAVCALLAGCSKTESAGAGSAPSSEAAAKPVAETKIAKHPWGSFKVGSFVAMKSTTEASGYKMASEMKTTLTALTADKATIEIETTVAGHTTKTSTDMPLTASATPVPTGSASTPQADVKTSEETITVAGKSLKCKVTSTTAEVGGTKSESKTWMSEEVPGFVVKSVVKSSGAASSESTTEVADFKAN